MPTSLFNTSPVAWRRLRDAARRSRRGVDVPKPDNWRRATEDTLWKHVVGQVAVIGGAAPWEALQASWPRLGIGYAALARQLKTAGEIEVARRIQRALASGGVRYVSGRRATSPKSVALARNLRKLHALGGPPRFFRIVSKLADEHDRCLLVREILDQFGMKSSRDLLMGLGMVRDTIALDSRVVGVLLEAGVLRREPRGAEEYDEVERRMLEKLCEPLRWEGVELDRTLFQHYEQVVRRLRDP